MAFKRKRVFAPRRNGMKKRRTNRSRFKKKKFTDFTSLNTKGSTLSYTAKKTSRSAYRKHLWNSTLFKQHWRSISVSDNSFNTPANNTTGTLVGTNMWKNAGTTFWTTAGGLQPADLAGSVPTFVGDIIVRGGRAEITFHNSSTTSDIRVRIFGIRTQTDPLFSAEPVAPPYSWDTTVSPDFGSLIGKTWFTRDVVIEQGNSYTFVQRIKMQKIDQSTYLLEGHSPLVYALISNVGHATPISVVVTRGYNLSFSGDGV